MSTTTPDSPVRPFTGYARAAAQPVRVTSLGIQGAVDGMVVQRGAEGRGTLRLSTAAGGFGARLLDADGAVLVEAAAPAADHGAALTLELAMGGPYTIEVSREGRTEVLAADVLVGDLWVLAGQSNMYGIGRLEGSESPHPLVHMLDMARRWRVAEEPLHDVSWSPDPVHHNTVPDVEAARQAVPSSGAGLGLAFASDLVEHGGVPVGLLPVAQGGTTMAQWAAELRDQGSESLYGSMALTVAAAGGRIRGVLWYQGESDAIEVDPDDGYSPALRNLVSGIRRDFGADLAFYLVQLCRVSLPPWPSEHPWADIRTRQLGTDLGVDGVAASIDCDMDDAIHVSTQGLIRVGRRLARLATGRAETIRVGSVTRHGMVGDPPETLSVRIALTGLRGGLRPRPHVPGFSIRTTTGKHVPMIYRAEVRPDDRHAVRLSITGSTNLHGVPLEDVAGIWYGYGADPFCDLVDEEDNAVPAFGPIPLLG